MFCLLKKLWWHCLSLSESDYVREFLRQWRQLDKQKYTGAADSSGISASGALAFDSVYVMEAAFKSLLQQKPNLFRHNVRRGEMVSAVFFAKRTIVLIDCSGALPCFFMIAPTRVYLLFIELMSHLSHVKQMFCQLIHLTHELILCIQIIRGRVHFNGDSTAKTRCF